MNEEKVEESRPPRKIYIYVCVQICVSTLLECFPLITATPSHYHTIPVTEVSLGPQSHYPVKRQSLVYRDCEALIKAGQ